VSKRVRGPARSHRRPGTRPASERAAPRSRPAELPAASPARPATEPDQVTQFVITQQPDAVAEPEVRAPVAHTRQRVKAGSLLATRAATEYVYVAKDMRRILIVAAALLGVMIVLWLLLVVMRVVPLPFY
jgi:hypothetical protein